MVNYRDCVRFFFKVRRKFWGLGKKITGNLLKEEEDRGKKKESGGRRNELG